MVGERVALSAYTTLGLGGPAGRFVAVGDDEQVITAVRQADRAGEPVLILGGGSNLVVADEGFPGTVIKVASRGISVADATPATPAAVDAPGADGVDGESVLVTVAAGEAWDRLVAWSVAEGLAGLECLSGIPGLAGATPIQNVGAYGQDVSETITEVRAFDRERDEVIRLSRADCEFGYR
ncbi:MAG: FAD-binding protein, partial [Streptosporangiaceae bacterium]